MPYVSSHHTDIYYDQYGAGPRTIVFGHGMGGWTGSQRALQHPDRVDALLMSHTPGVFFHPSAYNDPQRVAQQVSTRPMTGFGSAVLAAAVRWMLAKRWR